MVFYSKKRRHCRAVAAAQSKRLKDEKSIREVQTDKEASVPVESPEEPPRFDIEDEYHPFAALEMGEEDKGDSDVEEESDEEEERNAFSFLKQLRKKDSSYIKYARGPTYSDRHQRRLREEDEKRIEEASENPKMTDFFSPKTTDKPIAAPVPCKALKAEKRAFAIKDLESLLNSKRRPQGAQFKRHQAVLSLMYKTRSQEPGETRESMVLDVARCLNMGTHFAGNIVPWERSWIEKREIPEDMRGKNTKIWSLLNDESVKLTVRAAIDQEKESMCHDSMTEKHHLC